MKRFQVPSPAGYEVTSRLFSAFVELIGGLHVSGRENIENKGAIIVAANHDSWLDPPSVEEGYKRETGGEHMWAMAKEEAFKYIVPMPEWVNSHIHPMLGEYLGQLAAEHLRLCGTFPVIRDKLLIEQPDALGTVRTIATNNGALLMHPQGTRGNHQRGEVSHYHFDDGTMQLALEFGFNIQPAGVDGTYQMYAPHVHFGEVMPIEQQELNLASCSARDLVRIRQKIIRPLNIELGERIRAARNIAVANREAFISSSAYRQIYSKLINKLVS